MAKVRKMHLLHVVYCKGTTKRRKQNGVFDIFYRETPLVFMNYITFVHY